MEFKKGWEKTCVCLKRTQRKKLKRSTQTTYLRLVGGSDTTTHRIFRICPAPPATHGWRIFPLLWPFPSWKATLKKSMRKKNTKSGLFYINSSTQRTTLWFANLSQAAVSPKNLPDNPPPRIHRRPHLAGAAPRIGGTAPDGGFNSKSQMERCQIGGLVELIFRLKLENFELKHVRRSEDCHSFWDTPWWQLKLCTTCPIIHGCLFLFNNACFCIASRYSIAISWKGSWILCYHDIVTTKRKKHGSLGCGPPGCTRDQDNITCLGSSHRCGGATTQQISLT